MSRKYLLDCGTDGAKRVDDVHQRETGSSFNQMESPPFEEQLFLNNTWQLT
jgi:hypothetical protein